MTKPLKICYLLASSDLCGGVRVIFDQARALHRRGHQVSIFALRGEHRWYPYPIQVEYADSFQKAGRAQQWDVVIGTFWTTIAAALELPARLKVHLCQGCEWTIPEYKDLLPQIDAAYAQPIPKLTVGAWLNQQIQERFGTTLFDTACIGQIVDTELYRPPPLPALLHKRFLRRGPPRILVVGMFQSWFKGIEVALDAVEQVRRQGMEVHLTRVSPLPLAAEEQIHTRIDEYHEKLTPRALLKVYQDSDVFLSPSSRAEGFGLPFAEALACRLPTVATRIPSFLSLDPAHDYAYFVEERNAGEMALGLRTLLLQPKLGRRLAKRGSKLIHNSFSSAETARRIEQQFALWLGAEER